MKTARRTQIPQSGRSGVPILGICYGMHLMAEALGGSVVSFERKEFGPAVVSVTSPEGLFAGIEPEQAVWMSHGDSIERLPDGFRSTARTHSTPYAAVADPGRKLYGIQFHPEVVHTRRGRDILRNFVLEIAGARPNWTPANFISSNVEDIRRRVEEHRLATGTDGRVLCALSGGVDSAVAATLVHRAVGDRLTCVHVDHGMMRKNETELLRTAFEQLGVNVVVVDARERFLRKLEGVIDPERKRHIIGNEFIRVFEEEAEKLGRIDWLTQGTLYPDVIESATSSREKTAAKIKTHHNVGGLPDDIAFRLIEPLAVPLQGRGPCRRQGARLARLDGPAPALPGSRTRHPDHRRGHGRAARHAARSRLDRDRRDQVGGAVPRGVAVVRDPYAAPFGWGHGRRPNVR